MSACLFIAAARVVQAPSKTGPSVVPLPARVEVFRTEEEWRAWCLQDELDEAQEMIWSEIGRP